MSAKINHSKFKWSGTIAMDASDMPKIRNDYELVKDGVVLAEGNETKKLLDLQQILGGTVRRG